MERRRSATPSERSFPLPETITRKLVDFRSGLRRVKFLEVFCAGLTGLLFSLIALFSLDRLIETPQILRAALLFSGMSVFAIGLPLIWHRWVRGQRHLEDVARVIRHRFPRIGDQLLGTIELAHGANTTAKESPRLIQAAIEQAGERIRDEDLSAAIPTSHHSHWAAALGVLAVISAAATVLAPPAAGNALVRWLLPWADTPRYTFAQVDDLAEPLVVPYAEPFPLEVELDPSSRWRPASATARISDQPKLRSPLDHANTRYPFAFPPQKEDSMIKLRVGDDRAEVALHPRTRPELTSMVATLRLPEYLQYSSQPSIEIHGANARFLQGAEVSWRAIASRAMVKATVDGRPETVDDAGQLTTRFVAVDSPREHQFQWVDSLGLSPRTPITMNLEPVDDAPPVISVQRDSIEQVVLASEVLAFDITANDDFGIRQVGLEWTRLGPSQGPHDTKSSSSGQKLTARGAPELKRISPRATFCAQDEGVAPGVIQIRAWAKDYLPKRYPCYSPAVILRVLDTTDHALWLTEEFAKWLNSAREIYEREQQLNIMNRELRILGAADLDRTENRRLITRQAAEELANAARLEQVNQSGKRLVEQGTRNPEFNAGQLESWAAMIESLEALADERMPTVADLLDEASQAQTSGEKNPVSPAMKSDPSSPQQAKDRPQTSDQNGPPEAPSVPPIKANETSYLDPSYNDPDSEEPPPPPSSDLRIPGPTLGFIPGESEPKRHDHPPSPAEERLDRAISAQDALLAEFRAVAELLAKLLGSFEASTFVKRLKTASQAQMEISTGLNTRALSAFGISADHDDLPADSAAATRLLADQAGTESKHVQLIQSDLAAFIARKPDRRFTGLLKSMKEERVVHELETLPKTMHKNLSGQAIASAEFWSDTLDRWAEELVAATTGPP